MKVLIVEPYMGFYGGSATVAYNLALYLNRQGVKTSILSLTSKQEYEGIDIILPLKKDQIPYHIRSGNLSSLVEIYKMARILNKLMLEHIGDFDIINTHNTPALWSAPGGEKPVVWMCNEIPDFWHSYKLPWLVNQAANIGRFIDKKIVNKKISDAIVSDEINAQIFSKRYGWQPKIIHYGIEGEFFARKTEKAEEDTLRERFGLDNNAFYIVHPAMISPSKKQLDLLEAFNKIKNVLTDVKVIFAGLNEESFYSRLLRDYIKENNLETRVVFTGHISKDELRTLYNVSHMAVFPGRGQGSWLGPFESLSAGRPIVVSPNLPCSKIIEKENIGIVSDRFDEAIMDIYKNYDLSVEKTLRGKEFVRKNITYDKFGEKFLNILMSNLKNPNIKVP